MNKICVLYFTNTEYSDIWIPGIDRFNKYFKDEIQLPFYFLVNKEYEEKDKDKDFITNISSKIFKYENSWSYSKRLLSVLNSITEDYVIIFHDNNVLDKPINKKVFIMLEDFLRNNNVDQLRLSNSGITVKDLNNVKNKVEMEGVDIYKIDKNDIYQYSVLPAIWLRTTWIKLLNMVPNATYREIEWSNVQELTRPLNNYHLNYDETNNIIFPAFHVIHYGRWFVQFKEIANVIYRLSDEYKIDLNKRGFFV